MLLWRYPFASRPCFLIWCHRALFKKELSQSAAYDDCGPTEPVDEKDELGLVLDKIRVDLPARMKRQHGRLRMGQI